MVRYLHGALVVGSLATGCAGASPTLTETRASGQSRLLGETFAGQARCDPEGQKRPFVIEWDATDLSSFEARSRKDVVFVRYEGCELQILEGCRPEVTGKYGSYRPIEWTTGSLEAIDIESEGDLYAKLPLGAGSLGGRVAAGEQFRMEYFVAGTTSATREAITRDELAATPACATATHWVYGYNVGAFALGSRRFVEAEAGGSVFGFGAGRSGGETSEAEKTTGDLSVCRADEVTAIRGCQAPIRLTLRRVDDGPARDAAASADGEEAETLAGRVERRATDRDDAEALFAEANRKAGAGDGVGCLRDLDAKDRLDPRPDRRSTVGTNAESLIRARCHFLAQQCDAGKALIRRYYEAQGTAPAQVEMMASMSAAQTPCAEPIAIPGMPTPVTPPP